MLLIILFLGSPEYLFIKKCIRYYKDADSIKFTDTVSEYNGVGNLSLYQIIILSEIKEHIKIEE